MGIAPCYPEVWQKHCGFNLTILQRKYQFHFYSEETGADPRASPSSVNLSFYFCKRRILTVTFLFPSCSLPFVGQLIYGLIGRGFIFFSIFQPLYCEDAFLQL